MDRRGLVALGMSLPMLAAARAASAHAHLKAAVPAANSTVKAAPVAVVLILSEALEPRLSSIVVSDDKGVRVDLGDTSAVPNDAKRLSVGLKPLPPGLYSVHWKVTSVDTHRVEGHYTFRFAP